MIDLQTHELGVVLPVKAQPSARANAIRGEQDGALKVSVTQAPEKGKANKAIVVVLSISLGLKKSQIELLSGETSALKRFLIRDIELNCLRERIATVLNDDVSAPRPAVRRRLS